jgi:hypothetical protein
VLSGQIHARKPCFVTKIAAFPGFLFTNLEGGLPSLKVCKAFGMNVLPHDPGQKGNAKSVHFGGRGEGVKVGSRPQARHGEE